MIISLDKFKATGGTKVEGNLDITENGVYDVSGFATITINTDASQGVDYSYFTGGVDVEGLRAIGWDDESINYFRDNFNIYSWQAPDYMVTEENKALYGSLSYHDNFRDYEEMIYCPMIDFSTDCSFRFKNCKNLITIPKIKFSTANGSCGNMFESCFNLITIPNFDTSNIFNFQSMFQYCSSLSSIPQLDTSNAKSMNYMFQGCSSLTSIPPLDTKNVTNMFSMFNGCSKLTSIPPLDTKNVTNMFSMFSGCSKLTSIPQLDTSSVTNMGSMFSGCSKLTSIPLLDTNNVTDMSSMFDECSSLTSIPLLDTSSVTNISRMFYNCSKLTSIPQLDTSSVTNISRMFYNCSKLTSIPLLDTNNVTNIENFFAYSDITTLTDLGGFKDLKINWSDSYGLVKCPNLTYESVMNVINNLYDFVGNGSSETRTIKLHANSKALLSDADISIATNKGWTIS